MKKTGYCRVFPHPLRYGEKNARTGGAGNPCCALFRRTSGCGTGSRRDLDKLRLALGRRRAAALVWQSVALGLPRRWLRAVLPLLCLICAAAFSGRFLAGAITVSSSAGETLTKATGHILLPLAGVGADAALFVAISAALLGTLCAYAVRWSPTVCGLLLTVLSAALLALLRPDSAQVWMAVCPLCAALLLAGGAADRKESVPMLFELWRAAGSGRRACSCTAGRTGPAKRHIVFRVGERLPAPHCTGSGTNPGRLCCRRGIFRVFPPLRSRRRA